jgi:aminoglycoside phosphotransferase (APT) family kinase protein
MHPDELDIDPDLVRRLVGTQFPQYAALPLQPVMSSGTDHALYRLGPDLVVRLPRVGWAVGQVEKEQHWLPVLGPQLPLDIPVPVVMGEPDLGYPWRWSVYRWLDGETATPDKLADVRGAAYPLGRFVAALQRIDPAGGPEPGDHNSWRGVPLVEREPFTSEAIARLDGVIEVDPVREAWQSALAAPEWDMAPRWVHGDLLAGNLLTSSGRLSAVIDFGCLGVGDPACDLLVAWHVFSGEARDAYRAAVGVDDATWARGIGWALSVAVGALDYYRGTNPALVASAHRALTEIRTATPAG